MSLTVFVMTLITRKKIKLTNKLIEQNNNRLNLLSKENAMLYEENNFLKDKLKNLGFTEWKLK